MGNHRLVCCFEGDVPQPEGVKCMHRRNLGIVFFALLAGCGHQPESPLSANIGDYCTVQFRRDALGAASLVAPTTGSINGALVAESGRLVKATPDWIVITGVDTQGQKIERAIPTHAILFVQVRLEESRPAANAALPPAEAVTPTPPATVEPPASN